MFNKYSDHFDYRQSKRECTCRGCNKTISRDTEKIIYTYSIMNGGQNIYLCMDCIKEINGLISRDQTK